MQSNQLPEIARTKSLSWCLFTKDTGSTLMTCSFLVLIPFMQVQTSLTKKTPTFIKIFKISRNRKSIRHLLPKDKVNNNSQKPMDQSQFQCSKLRVDLAKENSDQLSCETTFCRRTLITNANKVKFLGYHVLASDPVSKSPSPTTQKLQPYIFFILIFIYIKNESN